MQIFWCEVQIAEHQRLLDKNTLCGDVDNTYSAGNICSMIKCFRKWQNLLSDYLLYYHDDIVYNAYF